MNSEQRRLERYKIIYTWKVLEGLVPNCGISEAPENSRQGRRCEIMKNTNTKADLKNKREASFQISGPKLFNSMPVYIRNLTKISQDEFKEHLDNYLTTIPDEPKVSGMTPTCVDLEAKPTNSLVHWPGQLNRRY